MENFLIEETFYSELQDFIDEYFEYSENPKYQIECLKDDWEREVQLTSKEKIIEFDSNFFTDLVDNYIYDTYVERFPEDCDRILEKMKKSIEQSIDIEKLNSLQPERWYPNGQSEKITKKDLLEYIA